MAKRIPHGDQLLVRLGSRIRTLRKERGWTQVEMAEKIGIDRSFLVDVERGKRNISFLNLAMIAKSLDLSLSKLLSRVEREPQSLR